MKKLSTSWLALRLVSGLAFGVIGAKRMTVDDAPALKTIKTRRQLEWFDSHLGIKRDKPAETKAVSGAGNTN